MSGSTTKFIKPNEYEGLVEKLEQPSQWPNHFRVLFYRIPDWDDNSLYALLGETYRAAVTDYIALDKNISPGQIDVAIRRLVVAERQNGRPLALVRSQTHIVSDRLKDIFGSDSYSYLSVDVGEAAGDAQDIAARRVLNEFWPHLEYVGNPSLRRQGTQYSGNHAIAALSQKSGLGALVAKVTGKPF